MQSVMVTASWLLIIAGVEIAVQGHDRRESLTISRLTLVESHDLDRHLVEETYSAQLMHTGPPGGADFARVTAKLALPFGLGAPGFAQVVDGDLAFGTVRAGETVDSSDTVTIRRHRQTQVKPDLLRWTIDAHPDLVPSDAWAGQWRFTLTRKDLDTDAVVMVADVTDAIGPGEPVGFSLLPEFARCRWGGSDQALDANCAARAQVHSCLVDGSAQFTVERSGDAIAGRGTLSVEVSGDCGATSSGGELIEIVGNRMSGEAEAEPFSFGLLTAFVTEPSFAAFIGDGLREAALGEPDSERDCGRGGWRRFAKARFRGEHECRSFCRQRRTGSDEWRMR
jgi:hypothetical protein